MAAKDAPVLGGRAATNNPRGFPRGAAALIGLLIPFSMMSLFLTPNLWKFTSGEKEESDAKNNDPSTDNFSLARTQSFGFFDDITNDNWKKLQDLVAHHWNHKFPEAPLTHHPAWKGRGQVRQVKHPAWYQTNFEPNFSCQFEMRIGATGEVSRGNFLYFH